MQLETCFLNSINKHKLINGYYCLLIKILLIATLIKSSVSHTEPHDRQWHCNNDRQCVRIDPTQTRNSIRPQNVQFNSYSLCHLVCDKYASMWPKPTNVLFLSSKYLEIHPKKIEIIIRTPDKPTNFYITKVADLFFDDLYELCADKCSPSINKIIVEINVENSDTSLTLETKENYSFNISSEAVEVGTGGIAYVLISAPTIFGARNGIQTLSQLIVAGPGPVTPDNPNSRMLYMLAGATFTDSPYYRHRGLLLDSARNYLSLNTIKRHIKAMGMNKMNVLHWHLTDTQSFPFVSNSVPEMSRFGAYSNAKTYTTVDLNHLSEYAKLHGVRLLLELDGPAHSGNGWQWGPSANLGELAVCVNDPNWRLNCIQPPCGQLNPVNPHVYGILGRLYGDMVGAVDGGDGGFFHMGGDEVFFPCWNSSQEIINYLKSQGRGTTPEDFLFLWGEYQRQASEAYDLQVKHNRTKFVMWSSGLTEIDVVEKYLDKKRYVIQTWVQSNDTLPHSLLKMGYDLIVSTKNAWYLDHGFWGNNKYYTWRSVYDNRLPDHPNVLGGEVCMWGEYVDDNTVDGKVWPRAAAAAERLWTNSPGRRSVSDEGRFYRHRERLVAHGIKADAVVPRWCTQNDGQC